MQDLYKAIIGDKNQAYYLQKFEYFDQEGPGLKASWNWPAFIFSGVWALYRKMYGWFFIFWGITILSNFIGKAGSPGLGGLILIGAWIAFGIFANSLYHSNVKKKIAFSQFSIKDESKLIANLNRKGGIHTWVVWVFGVLPVIGIVAAIAIPAYHDYTVQNKPVEASEKYDWSKVKVDPQSCQSGYYVKQNKCVEIEFTPIPDAIPPPPEGFEIEQAPATYAKPWGNDPIIEPAKPEIVQGSANETSATSSSNIAKSPNFSSKEQKCQDQYYATVNSANHDMPIGEFAEFNKRARQRERECINR